MPTDFSPELLRTRQWRAFTPDTPEDEAAARFSALYGAPPQFIIEEHGLLFVGPIPQKELSNAN